MTYDELTRLAKSLRELEKSLPKGSPTRKGITEGRLQCERDIKLIDRGLVHQVFKTYGHYDHRYLERAVNTNTPREDQGR
jgi:hypothetical protein